MLPFLFIHLGLLWVVTILRTPAVSAYFYFNDDRSTLNPSHDPYLVTQSPFTITGRPLLATFVMSDRSCQITPASELIAQANSSALATVFSPDDKTILLFATISEHCSSYAAVIDIIVKEWEPAAVAFGFPPIKAVMFHAHYPKFNPQAYGGPFDQTANSHHLSKSPYLYALYPHGAAEDAIGALAHIQADGHIPRATVTIVQESGPWNPIVTSKAFTALYYLFSVSSLVAATFTIALVGYNAWCQGWQWDYRVALVLIGTGYSAIRIAIPNICDLTVVQDVFLQISFILGNFAYVIFATIWVQISNEICSLRSHRYFLYFLWFTLCNFIIMVLCAFFTKLMFTERVASSFIHTLLGLVNTPLILIANVWLLALTVVVWRNLRFVRVPPQFRRDYRLVTVLTAVVTVAFTTTSLTGKHLGQPFITISSFIASVVITVLADTLLIITIFVAVGGIRFLQTSYLKTLGLTWDLNVVHRLSVASFPESPRHSTTTTVDSQAEEKIHPFTAEVVRPGPRINRPLTSVTLATVAHSTLSRATSSRSKTETVAGDLLGHCGNARGEEYPLHGETAATRFYGPHPTAPRPDSCIEVTEEDIVAQPTTSEPTQSRVTIDGIPEQLATMLDTTGPSQLLSSSYGEPNMFASSKTGPLGLRPPQPALQLRPLNSLGVNSKRRPTPVINPSFVPSFPSELVPNAKSSSPAKSTVANATSAPYSPTFSTAATKVLDPETGSPNLVASSSIGVLRGVELAGGRHSLKKVLQRGSKYLSLNERTFRKPSGKSNGS